MALSKPSATPSYRPEKGMGTYTPFILLALGATLISFSPVYVKCADVGPAAAGFYRVFFGGIILFLWCFKDVRLLDRSDLMTAAAASVFFSLDLFLWHFAIERVGPGLATILANFQVFFMAVVTVLAGQRFPWIRMTLYSIAAMIGLFLIVGITPGNIENVDFLGIFAGLAAAFCYTGFILILRKNKDGKPRQHPMIRLALICLFSSLFMGIWAFYSKSGFMFKTPVDGILMAGYALSSQVIGWALITKGLPRVPYVSAGLLLLIQPALSFVWDVAFFDLPATWMNLTGCAITLGAVYLGSLAAVTPASDRPRTSRP